MVSLDRLLAAGCLAVLALIGGPVSAQEKVLRITPHSNLTILDPVWTTAYITRNHGYMIYDTLFATDAKGKVQPQMVAGNLPKAMMPVSKQRKRTRPLVLCLCSRIRRGVTLIGYFAYSAITASPPNFCGRPQTCT